MPVIKQNQTLFDMAVQYTGSLENLFLVAVQNQLSITSELIPGNSIAAAATEKRVTRYFESIVYDVVTIHKFPLPPGGIGYMQIENNFKVS